MMETQALSLSARVVRDAFPVVFGIAGSIDQGSGSATDSDRRASTSVAMSEGPNIRSTYGCTGQDLATFLLGDTSCDGDFEARIRGL